MDERTAKHFSFLVNLVYFAVFVVLFYLFVHWALPLVTPFLIAFCMAALLQKPVNALNRKTKIPRGIAGTVLVLLIIGVLAALIGVVGAQTVAKLKDFVDFLMEKVDSLPALLTDIQNGILNLVEKLPETVAAPITDAVRNFSVNDLSSSLKVSLTADNIFSTLKTPISGAWSTVKQLPSVVISILITIISACFLTKDYTIIRDFIYLQLTGTRKTKLIRAKKIVTSSIGKIIKSYCMIILITAAELTIGLSVLKLLGFYNSGYIIGISVLIAIIDIIPVLGTGTVLVPWAVIALLTGSTGMGIGLIVVYAVITIIRQIIEPKLVAGQFDLPAIVTIASMFIGTKIFGAVGLFLLPLTVIVLKLLADEGIIGFIKTKRSVARAEAEKQGATPEEIDERFEAEQRKLLEDEKQHPANPGQKLAAFLTKAVTEKKEADRKAAKGRIKSDGKHGEKPDNSKQEEGGSDHHAE